MTHMNVCSIADWDRVDWSDPDLTEVVVDIDDPYVTIDGSGRCDTNTGIAVVVDSRIGVVKNVGHLVVKPRPDGKFNNDNLRIKNCAIVNINDGAIVGKVVDSYLFLDGASLVFTVENCEVASMSGDSQINKVIDSVVNSMIDESTIGFADKNTCINWMEGMSQVDRLEGRVLMLDGCACVEKMTNAATIETARCRALVRNVEDGSKVEAASELACIYYTPTGVPADKLAPSVIVGFEDPHYDDKEKYVANGGTLVPYHVDSFRDLRFSGFKQDADGSWVGVVFTGDLGGKNRDGDSNRKGDRLTVYPPYAVSQSSDTTSYKFSTEDLLSIGFSEVVVKRSSK